jgi:hypothetical protein
MRLEKTQLFGAKESRVQYLCDLNQSPTSHFAFDPLAVNQDSFLSDQALVLRYPQSFCSKPI